MDCNEISRQLIDLINNRKVIAGIFTTYTFEPDFFELDVIPLLLKSDITYSTDERVKTFQVREALRESTLELEVFYDLPIVRQSIECSPSMEYKCHGVNEGNSAFHAKNIYLLVEEDDSSEQTLFVAAGSNNLTRSGWWDSIEVQHWEEIQPSGVDSYFLDALKDDLLYLKSHQGIKVKYALEKIDDFLTNCQIDKSAPTIHYFGLGNNSRNFIEFLSNSSKSDLDQFDDWSCEIVSPFFADNAENTLHDTLLKQLPIRNIILFLPEGQDREALCNIDYYLNIKNESRISWGKWGTSVAKNIGVSDDYYRRLHAKIYRFYNDNSCDESWIFVGSVNFSYKAFYENVESGFFVNINDTNSLLEEIPDNEDIEKFANISDLEPGQEIKAEASPLPELHINYNWIDKTLSGRTSENDQHSIQIQTPEGSAVIDIWNLTEKENNYSGDITKLEALLKQGGLVNITGSNDVTGQQFPQHKILLQQTGWTHKPLDLPSLSPEQILAIYAGMSPERRQLLLVNEKLQSLVNQNLAGEINTTINEQIDVQFFCEYAEIFHAFRNLKKLLLEAIEKEDKQKRDYYLTGTGMDSLPSLIEKATNTKEGSCDGVISYLLLLSAKELYLEDEFESQPNVQHMLENIELYISDIKNSNRIQLEKKGSNARAKFFTWFETQFSQQYISITGDLS